MPPCTPAPPLTQSERFSLRSSLGWPQMYGINLTKTPRIFYTAKNTEIEPHVVEFEVGIRKPKQDLVVAASLIITCIGTVLLQSASS